MVIHQNLNLYSYLHTKNGLKKAQTMRNFFNHEEHEEHEDFYRFKNLRDLRDLRG